MMRFNFSFLLVLLTCAFMVVTIPAQADVVINEIVDDNRLADSTGGSPDTSEFIELYNSGETAVNIGGWTLNYWQLKGEGAVPAPPAYFPTNDEIPLGTIIQPHAFYVLGHDSVPNVNQPLGSNIDLFPDLNTVFELRDGPQATGALKDAVALETWRALELANLKPEHPAQVGGGYWGQTLTMFTNAPNVPSTIARFQDGRDTNVNGRDFGFLPITPGASNNLPQNASHTIPNVDALAVGSELSANYYASFVLPRVIDPTQVGPIGAAPNNINPKAIPVSPQLGKAIIAYDETGGGNAVYSKELVNKFSLYAYIETADLNITTSTAIQHEASTYGIGTTDPFFTTPNQAGLNTLTSTSNGNTGVGWMIQRAEAAAGGATTTLLQLIDFNDGGDSIAADNDWKIIQTIDLSAAPSGWHALSVDYNPATGSVVAKYDAQTFGFDSIPGLLGTFYTGYRENLPGTGNAVARPPTYDLFVATGIPGDYTGDGKVDAADYTKWRDNLGSATTLPNDATPGVSAGDYDVWKAHFGQGPGSGGGGGALSVPEPGTLALVACAIGLMFVPRKRV